MALKDDLIEIALQDIKASRLLYSKKLYAQSYFYFQQASEKATKAFGLFTEIIREEDLKKDIQHNQLKVYFKGIVKEEDEVRHFVNALNNRPDIAGHSFIKGANIEAYHKNLQEGLKFHHKAKQLNLLSFTKEKLLYYLQNLEEMYSVKIRLTKKAKELFNKEIQTYISFGERFGNKTEMEEMKKIFSENGVDGETFKQLKIVWWYQFRGIYINYAFYFCALLTIRHSNLSRYPDGAENPLTFYNRKNPIVQYQLDFLFNLERGLISLRRLTRANSDHHNVP